MTPEIMGFGEGLANAAIARDWDAVHGMLAPWLRTVLSSDGVRDFFENDYRAMLKHVNIDVINYPEIPYVSGNNSSLIDLREKGSWTPRPRPIPHEVTDLNFRKWMCIRLHCSQEQADELDCDFLTEVWLIVVEHDGELKVGYWSHNPYEVAPEGWTNP